MSATLLYCVLTAYAGFLLGVVVMSLARAASSR